MSEFTKSLGAETRNDIPRVTFALSGKDNTASGSMGEIFPARRELRALPGAEGIQES